MARIDNRRMIKLETKITRNYTKYAEGSVLIEMGSTSYMYSTIEDKALPFLEIRTGYNAEYSMLPRSSIKGK